MQDPYVTNCGISYEKLILLDHINRNGKFDPVTRNPILYYIPNIALKQYIQEYLYKNPWAFESYE
jgi:STIP1 family protein 1